MLHKSHVNIFFIWLRWSDFQQLKCEADVDHDWMISALYQSNWGRKCTFFPVWEGKLREKASSAEVQLCDLSSHDCSFLRGRSAWPTRGSGSLWWDSTAPVSHSPAWWHLWLWWDDTPASRPRNSLRTSPEARRKGCRCAPPLSGTPAPPLPASRWSCRSCDSTLLQTSTLWIRE